MEKKKKIALIASVISVCIVVVIVCAVQLNYNIRPEAGYDFYIAKERFKSESSVMRYGECYQTCHQDMPTPGTTKNMIADSLGAAGQKYHDEIRELVKSKKKGFWVGLSDHGKEIGWELETTHKYFDLTQGNTVFPLGNSLLAHIPDEWNPQCVFYSPESGTLESTSCRKKEFYCLCEVKHS